MRDYYFKIQYYTPAGHLEASYVCQKRAEDLSNAYDSVKRQHRPVRYLTRVTCITESEYERFINTESKNWKKESSVPKHIINITPLEAQALVDDGYLTIVYAYIDCEGFNRGDIVSKYKNNDGAARRVTCNKAWAMTTLKECLK